MSLYFLFLVVGVHALEHFFSLSDLTDKLMIPLALLPHTSTTFGKMIAVVLEPHQDSLKENVRCHMW